MSEQDLFRTGEELTLISSRAMFLEMEDSG